MEFGLNKTAR